MIFFSIDSVICLCTAVLCIAVRTAVLCIDVSTAVLYIAVSECEQVPYFRHDYC